jgi:hypothetical protein
MIKDETIKWLFTEYEAAFRELNIAKSAGFFSNTFISAGPKGAIAQSKAEFIRLAGQSADFYKKVGQTSAKIVTADEIPISEEYSMVNVHWGVTFKKTGNKLNEFDVSYIVHKMLPDPEIIMFIAHQDEKEAMHELGLL